MGSILLPALNIRPPENPLDQYAKALSVKSMMQGQQVQAAQLTGEQLKNQLTQRSIADENAMTKSMTEWDGKDLNELPAIVLKNGGSANAVFGVRKQILDQKQALSKIALDDSTTGKNNLETYKGKVDQIAGSLEALVDEKQMPDADLHQEANRTVNDLMANNLIDAQHGQLLQQKIDATSDPAALRTMIDHYAKAHMGASAAAALAKEQAETGHAIAEANLTNQKVKLYASTKSGDFDQQIDMLVPPTGDNPNADLNKQAKVMVNGLLARGDYEGAAKALENTQHVLDQRLQTNYVQNREDQRAQMSRAASQADQLQKNAIEQINKIWTDPQHGYTQFLAQANATKQAITDSQNGNELASSLAPLMTVLGVNSFAGVHRINPQEYAAAGPAVGSIYRQINSVLDKAVSGKYNPDTAKEAAALVDQLIAQKHASLVPATQMIANNAKDAKGAPLDPKQITVFDKDGGANTLDNVTKGIVSPSAAKSAAAAPKILTLAQIQQAAKDHNISVEEATKQAKAAGYEVK